MSYENTVSSSSELNHLFIADSLKGGYREKKKKIFSQTMFIGVYSDHVIFFKFFVAIFPFENGASCATILHPA